MKAEIVVMLNERFSNNKHQYPPVCINNSVLSPQMYFSLHNLRQEHFALSINW